MRFIACTSIGHWFSGCHNIDLVYNTKSGKKANIFRISPSIFLRLSKKVLEKFKFYKGKKKANDSQLGTQSSCLYTQVSRTNINDIMKIKNNFPNLFTKKIEL